MHKYIEESIPDEHQKCLVGINQVLDITWDMVNSGDLDSKTKLQALALVNDCNKYKMDLATGSAICNEAIKFVTQRKEQLNKLETLQKVEEVIEEMEEEEADKTTNGVF